MGILTKLFSGQRRTKEREEIHPFHKIRVKIGNEQYQLTDYSEKGLACTREVPEKKEFPFKEDEVLDADFLIFGHRKASTRVKIMWTKETDFGCKIVDTESFKTFANQYLTYVKSK